MNGPLKWPGGKHYLAQQIIALMPVHTHYVEPYGGGLAVMFARSPEGISEVVNDIHQDLQNFWRVLQSRRLFRRFRRQVEAIPFSEIEWQDAHTYLEGSCRPADQVERAVKFFIFCRQSMAGRCQSFAPLTRNRTRRGMNEQASAWLKSIAGLPAVHARLQRVVILNRPALEVITSQDSPESLFYLDPPYLHETRTSHGNTGMVEMTDADHEALLACLLQVQGKVMLSGYASDLYNSKLRRWHRHESDLPNNAASDVIKRRMTEVLWCNFKPVAAKRAA